MPGSSGRVHKNTEGEWVWSDDEMDTSNDTTAEPVSQSVSPAFKNFLTYNLPNCCKNVFVIIFHSAGSCLCSAIALVPPDFFLC